ncbi:MAG: LptF/LptG family permease [Candidatus Binatia bacterium]|nr:LptF/LptG family permease [Candidatus Binatia bacterium]
MALFQKYVFRQLLFPTIASITLSAALLLVGRLVKIMSLLINRGLGLAEVTYLLLLLAPSFLEYSVPMGAMLGTFLALGRMTSDGELLGAQASGLNPRLLLRPLLLLGAFAALCTSVISLGLRPLTRQATTEYFTTLSLSRATAAIEEQVFFNQIPGLVLYAEQIRDRGKTLLGVFVVDQRTPGRWTAITAKNGYIVSADGSAQPGTILRLEDGTVFNWKGRTEAYEFSTFETFDWNLSEAMNQATSSSTLANIDLKSTQSLDLLDSIRKQPWDKTTPTRALELSSRFALPASCFVLVLLALTCSLRWQLSPTAGIAISTLCFLTYYTLSGVAESVAEQGISWPLAASIAWLPNLALSAGYVFLGPASGNIRTCIAAALARGRQGLTRKELASLNRHTYRS